MTTTAEATNLDRLWERQKELGWSDRELAKRLGVSNSLISTMKRGLKSPGEIFSSRVASLFPDLMAAEKPEVPESTALSEAINDFLNAKRIIGRSARTVDDFYAIYLRHFLMWTQENRVPQIPALITRTHIRSFLAYLQSTVNRWGSDHPRARKQITPGGRHAYYRALKAFFNWLVGEEILEKSPVRPADAPAYQRPRIETFNLADIPRMLNAYGDDPLGLRNRAIILVFLDTGFRLDELREIEMPRIDFQRQTILVLGKGSKEREGRFSTRTKKAIEDWLPERDKFNASKSEYLWLTSKGSHLSKSHIYTIISALAVKAGITGVRCSPHTFRHTCCTELLRATRDLKGVSVYMGHAAVAVTEEYLKTFSSEDALQTHEKAAIVDRLFEHVEEKEGK